MSVLNNSLVESLGARVKQVLSEVVQNPNTNARLALASKILLVALIAYSAADLSWRLMTPMQLTIATPAKAKASITEVPQTSLDPLAKLHLFGKVSEQITVKEEPIVAPETRLRMELKGVFASATSSNSMAIIAEHGKKDKAYSKGDTLPGNATLHEIYADRVILSRNGKLETLPLKKKSATIELNAPSQTRPPAPDLNPARPSRNPRNANRLNQTRQLIKSNPRQLWKNVRVTPKTKNGQLQGYQFNHTNRQFMREAGLQPQDVITAVNGTPVSNAGALMKMLDQIDSLQQLNLSIIRNGSPQSLTVKLN